MSMDLLYSFYGDDFTGSTDVMEALSMNGVPAALFLHPPSPSEVEAFRLKIGVGDHEQTGLLKAVGVAGTSRSWSPGEMSTRLPSAFAALARLKADFFQYKVCSTFDSSPEVGNIGHAIELALPHFPTGVVPLLVAAPSLNRFQSLWQFVCPG